MSKLRFIWAVLKQVRSGKINEHDDKTFHEKDVLYFQTDKLIIHNLDAAPLHIDGEPSYTAKKFVFEIIPDAFKLIQAKQ
jgi:diacylglycerol kinase family enzyme